MTDWESHYQKQDMPWDKGAPSPGLVDFLQEWRRARSEPSAASPLAGLDPQQAIVPGCGLGHDVRALAKYLPRVVGLDLAPSAVEAARRLPASGAEEYEVGNLFQPPSHLQAAFDLVWEHTCFCAIAPADRPDYVRSTASLLRPGGYFLGIFYLDPGNALPTDGPPFETTLAELDLLFREFYQLVAEWSPQHAYPGREHREWMRLLRRR